MVLTTIFVLSVVGLVLPLYAQNIISNEFETNISFHTAENNVLFEMNVIDIQNCGLHQMLSTDDTLKKSIFYWLHSHIFQLIDSSYLYGMKVDKYTSNLWNEYCLQIISVSNDYNQMTFNMNIVISQIQIKQIIAEVLKTNGQEISAFIRFKLTDFITNYYAEITINDLYVDLMLISPTSTEGSLIVHEKTSNKKTYVLIIGLCILIVTIGLCVYEQTQKSMEDIKSLVFIGQKLNTQHQKHELVSKPISIKSVSDVSDITNVKTLPNQIDDNKNNSPEIPIMNNEIFNTPLPLPLQNCPSSESFSNLITLPQKQQSKPSNDVCENNKSKNQILYDYNGSIANIKHKKRKRTTIDHTQQSKSPNITHKQKISYDDNAQIGCFKIIDNDQLGNSWFNHVITDSVIAKTI